MGQMARAMTSGGKLVAMAIPQSSAALVTSRGRSVIWTSVTRTMKSSVKAARVVARAGLEQSSSRAQKQMALSTPRVLSSPKRLKRTLRTSLGPEKEIRD
jgi:hypothetical protein